MLQAVRLLTEVARFGDNQERSNRGMDPQTSSMELSGSVQFREIHKNGWLRRTDKSEKELSRFWVVFCVHDDTDPRLEGYSDQKLANGLSPAWVYSLRNVLYLSPTLCATSRHDYEFCVNFNDNQVLRLAAPTYSAMCDWVQVVTRKLTDMKILKPKENVYSKGPERIVTRDPMSPLPPPPIPTGSANAQRTPNVEVTETQQLSTVETTPLIFTFDNISIESHRDRPSRSQRPAITPISASTSPRVAPTTPMTTTTTTTNDDGNNSSYERLFLATSYSPNWESTSPSNNESTQNDTPSNDHYVALMQYRSAPVPEIRNQAEENRNPSNPTNLRRQLTLREQQVFRLKKEMSHISGVRLQLGRRDCKDSIAFVELYGSVWVAGWKPREHPLLYNVLHIGDAVMSIAGVFPFTAADVRNILKNCTTPRVDLIVRRLPHARAMTLTRSSENEDFGLEVNGNEVIGISGNASNLGLSLLTASADPTAPRDPSVTWTLTEVNGRPLNVFDGGARERLSAVGRDISIVVQPTDFVTSLRKKLRTVRGYKQFILQ